MERQKISVQEGGWVRWQSSDYPHTVFVRVADTKGRLVISELHVSTHGGRLDARSVHRLPLGQIETWVNEPEEADKVRLLMNFPAPDVLGAKRARALPGGPPAVDLKLDVPDTFRYGDDFYEQVAAAYREAGQYFANPARQIADKNGVPLATVQRWVKEARRRGVLGPGRPRKERG